VEAGELDSALSQFRQELRLFEALSAADPKDVQGRRNRSLAHKQIGDVLMRKADVRGALAQYRSALEIDRDLVSADPDNFQAVLDLSFSETKAGSAMGKLGQTQAGLLLLRSGVAKQEAMIAKDPRHVLLYSHLAGSYTLLANSLLDSADRKTAIEYYRKAVAARLSFSEKSPTNVSNRRALAECHANLAKALEPTDRAEAIKQYGNAIETLEHLTPADGTNALSRIARADSLSSAARLYVRMAELGGESSSRFEYWTKARSFYQHSQQLWMELESTGKLPSTRREVVREVNAQLARCDDSLEKLGHSH